MKTSEAAGTSAARGAAPEALAGGEAGFHSSIPQFLYRDFRPRQHQREARASIDAAADLDRAAMGDYNFLHQREADAGAGLARFLRAAGPVEFLKNALHLLLVHAVALVFDRYTNLVTGALYAREDHRIR